MENTRLPDMSETGGSRQAHPTALPRWGIPERSLAIEFQPEAMEGLLVEAMSGLGLLSRGRGVETGGILLGSVRREGELRCIRLLDFRPLPCEHARGPAYLLSDAELAELRRMAAAWSPRPGRQPYLVGFWRSHTRGPLALRAEDVAVLGQLKGGGCELALLVEPRGAGPAVAALFLPEGGSFQSGPPAATYPIGPVRRTARDAQATTAGPPEAKEPQATAAVETAAAISDFRFSMFSPPDGDSPPSVRPKSRSIAIMLVALAVAGAGAIALSQGYLRLPDWQIPPWQTPRNPYSLGLRVGSHGDNLHLSWDPACPAIELAQKGILIIADGDWLRVIELDSAQLRHGTAVYRPIGGRVSFRVELRWSRNALSESVEWEAP